MPNKLVWKYEGKEKARHAEQCADVGDNVHDDCLGEAKAVRLDGAYIVIEVMEDGERVQKPRTKGHVYAQVQRSRALETRTGRRADGQQGLRAVFFGEAAEAAVGAEKAKKRQRGGAFAEKPKPKGKGATATPAAKPPYKRHKTVVTPLETSGTEDEVGSPTTLKAAKLPGLALLGAVYADSDDEEGADGDAATLPAGGAGGKAKAGPIATSFRMQTVEKKAEMRHDQYEARKTKSQDTWFVAYGKWLGKDKKHGAHCKVCISSLTKPKDKLSTTGYGWVGEGDLCVMILIPSEAKLKEHQVPYLSAPLVPHHHPFKSYCNSPLPPLSLFTSHSNHPLFAQINPLHVLNVSNHNRKADGDARVYLTITPEDELYARTIRTVHLIAVRQLSLNDMYSLLELQNANGAIVSFDHAGEGSDVDDGGVAAWLEAAARVWRKQQRERAQGSIMTSLFPRGSPFGFLGDGSNDRSLVEQEAIVTRHLGNDGKPYNAFFDLAPLDLATSADKRSPDALCMTACYSKSFDQLNEFEGFVHLSDWKKAAIGGSFDGASVMLGSQNGTAKLLKDNVETHLTIIHACAHVEQLGLGDAFKEVTYYEEWRLIVQEVYIYYSGSGKKRFGLEEVANSLSDKLLKIKGTHGIRWAAAQARTLVALMADLPSVVVDLEEKAKASVGCQFTLLTPSNSFLGKSFKQRFEPEGGGRISYWKATVAPTGLLPSADGISANDRFTLVYSNKTTLTCSKAELVAHLTDEDASGLVDEYEWQLRSRLVALRFAAFTAFMLDVHNQLGILSKSYQSNSLVIFDISKNLNRTLRVLQKLKILSSCGAEETKFWAAVGLDDADCLRTCQLEDGVAGRAALKTDRVEVVDSLNSHLIDRFQKVLDDPILEAFSIFDVRKWPTNKDILKSSYKDGIELLYSTYKIFYTEEETLEMVLDQWEDLKAEINVPTMRTLSFHELWACVLVQFTDEYRLVLRLVVISRGDRGASWSVLTALKTRVDGGWS